MLRQFPVEWQEVVHFAEDGEKHVADVKTSTGLVIEFQHSAITKEEVLSRTAFYQKIIWVVDGRRIKNDFKKFDSRPNLFPWKKFAYPNFTEVNLPPNAFPSYKTWQFLDTPVIFDWGDVKSDYWISDWHALAGRAVHGWFCVDKAELINLLINDKTFYHQLT